MSVSGWSSARRGSKARGSGGGKGEDAPSGGIDLVGERGGQRPVSMWRGGGVVGRACSFERHGSWW
jgi:hypothetical protein